MSKKLILIGIVTAVLASTAFIISEIKYDNLHKDDISELNVKKCSPYELKKGRYFSDIDGINCYIEITDTTFALVGSKDDKFKATPHKDCASDAQSDFSADCMKTTQAYCRMSRSFRAR